jgi:transcriptional regulator with XRE-family HTH domain
MGLKRIFIPNLKSFRKIEKISQMKLAEKCDTDASYIGQIEMGIRFPSMELIEKIARALKIEPYRFFMEDPGDPYADLGDLTDFLSKLPNYTREDMIDRLDAAIKAAVREALRP